MEVIITEQLFSYISMLTDHSYPCNIGLFRNIDSKYRSIPRKRPWALNPSKLNRGGVGAYPG